MNTPKSSCCGAITLSQYVWPPVLFCAQCGQQTDLLGGSVENPLIKQLVDKFLSWPLPESVCADPCATKQGYPHRVGTNLLSADEARQMLEYLFSKPAEPAGATIKESLTVQPATEGGELKRLTPEEVGDIKDTFNHNVPLEIRVELQCQFNLRVGDLITTCESYATIESALRQRIAELEKERCEDCNFELVQCGPLNDDGEPTLDCKVCQLREKLKAASQNADANLNALTESQERVKVLEGALIKIAEHGCEGDIGDCDRCAHAVCPILSVGNYCLPSFAQEALKLKGEKHD